SYWREALEGVDAATVLSIGRPSERETTTTGERLLRLPSETTAALDAFARRHGLTASTVLQGAWALLLARYSGARDVVFGATQSGRSIGLPEVDRMVGLFITTLPVRVRIPTGARVLPWLEGLQDRQAAQLPHAHSSLVDIRACSDVPAGHPLFDT